MNQKIQILSHLKTHGSITPLDALNLYGCMRLGARIYDLINDGENIISVTEEKNGKRYARYHLKSQIKRKIAPASKPCKKCNVCERS